MDEYDCLKLENQLCFPLYVASKYVVRSYTPILEEFDLTYTQYIAMMAMWERQSLSMNELGKILYLDSGTLTPLVNKLIKKGYLQKQIDLNDKRMISITLTEKGANLKREMKQVPSKVAKCINVDKEEAQALRRYLDKIITSYEE